MCNFTLNWYNSILSHILHHSQEQAFQPVPQQMNFIVRWARARPERIIENGQGILHTYDLGV